MKPHPTLSAAVALALSAGSLLAQENQPTPPPRPPEHGSGPAPADARHAGHHRQGAGFFAALDANHDGAIDLAELNQAGEILRKLDHDGNGRLTPDELRPAGGEHRRGIDQRDGAREAGRRQMGEQRLGAQRDPRAEGPGEGARGPAPERMRHEGGRPPEGRVEERPAAGPAHHPEGPRGGERADAGRGERKPSGEGRREFGGPRPSGGDRGPQHAGPQGPAAGEPMRGQPRGPRGDGFAERGPRPDFGPGNQRAPWQRESGRDGAAPRGPLAFAPQQGERREVGRGPANDRQGRPEMRHELGAQGPQRDFHRGGPDQDRPMPPRDGDRPGPQTRGDMRDRDGDRRPEGGPGMRQQRPPMDDRGPRPDFQ